MITSLLLEGMAGIDGAAGISFGFVEPALCLTLTTSAAEARGAVLIPGGTSATGDSANFGTATGGAMLAASRFGGADVDGICPSDGLLYGDKRSSCRTGCKGGGM